MAAVGAWPVWGLRRGLAVYIFAVVAAYLAAIGFAAREPALTTRGFVVLGGLLACFAATVELTKRGGERSGHTLDVYGVWELPVAILLPPLYALAVPAFGWILTQWRVRRAYTYRRVFSAAVTGLSYGAASLTFHGLMAGQARTAAFPATTHPELWIIAVAGAGLARWVVNVSLLMPAIKGSDPTATIRKMLLTRETVHNDVAELCVAVLVAAGLALSPVTIVFALPFVTLLQRSFRHAYLVNASRIDSKTGLLNAGTWEREASSEVARAVRTRSPLAVALIDVDHFKAVNDAHGHLAGDRALKAISRTLSVFLREYDLVGRFGGEEFALLLPQTKAVDAYRIAERIRAYIAAMPIDAHNDPGAEPVTVTVSIGVAAVGARWDAGASQLTDLLAAADAALYRAKRDGRDRVCVVTEKTTFGAQETTTLPGGTGQGTPASGQAPPRAEISPSGEATVPSPEPAGSQPLAFPSGQPGRKANIRTN
jgi:diguanylate cyclase (GGDEF)-like protein